MNVPLEDEKAPILRSKQSTLMLRVTPCNHQTERLTKTALELLKLPGRAYSAALHGAMACQQAERGHQECRGKGLHASATCKATSGHQAAQLPSTVSPT